MRAIPKTLSLSRSAQLTVSQKLMGRVFGVWVYWIVRAKMFRFHTSASIVNLYRNLCWIFVNSPLTFLAILIAISVRVNWWFNNPNRISKTVHGLMFHHYLAGSVIPPVFPTNARMSSHRSYEPCCCRFRCPSFTHSFNKIRSCYEATLRLYEPDTLANKK